MHGASSSPANPKQRLAKKRTIGSWPKSGMRELAVIAVAEPEWTRAMMPTTSSAPDGSH